MIRTFALITILGLCLAGPASAGAQAAVQIITAVVAPAVLIKADGEITNATVPFKAYTHEAGGIRITTYVDQTP